MGQTRMKVDTHQHFWNYDAREYGWIDESMQALRRDFTPVHLQREIERAGVDCTVAVQVRQTLDETRWLLALADAHPGIAGVVGWVDLQAAHVESQLEELTAHPQLIGVRHIVQSEPAGFLSSPTFRRGLASLERFALTYDILVYARQLPEVVELVAAFPNLRFVLDHLGKPDIKGGGFETWRPHFEALAAFPHVWCKLSGLVTEADWSSWTAAQLQPYIDTALERFGPDRLMIGSDWPVCTLASSYVETLDLLEHALQGCTPAERANVLGGTAQRLWNLSGR
jgi:L-fuconolactonase